MTTGMLCTPLQMARSLDLPSNLRVLLRSDSTLTTYVSPKSQEQGIAYKKNASMVQHLKWKHGHYT